MWRVLTGADPAAVNAAIGAWLLAQAARTTPAATEHATAEHPAVRVGEHAEKRLGEPATSPGVAGSSLVGVAVDGKAVRGAVSTDGEQTHLLAAATHGEQLVLGQVQVGVKSNEIPQFTPLISGLVAAGVDLSHVVITADALHCQRGHATYLHERGAQYLLPGQAQPARRLHRARRPALGPDPDRSPQRRARPRTDRHPHHPGPARAGGPTVHPHVNQVWLIERYTHDTTGGLISAVAQLGLTSLTPAQADPTQIAGFVQHHWGIESLHWP